MTLQYSCPSLATFNFILKKEANNFDEKEDFLILYFLTN